METIKEIIKKYFLKFKSQFISRVKTLNLTSYNGKFAVAFLIILTLFVIIGILLVNSSIRNKELKQTINTLNSVNNEQRKLLEDERNNNNNLKLKINELTKKFNSLANNLTSRSGGKSSRSGEGNSSTIKTDIKNIKDIIKTLNDLASENKEASPELKAAGQKLEKYLKMLPTQWPTSGRLSDKFGYRKDPFTKKKKFHEGLDISASYGKDIIAAADGKVIKASRYSGYGRTVIIDHGNGLCTLYGHTSKLLVKEGQKVKKGQVIAEVGSSGRSTGPHLHFEVLLDDTPVNPLQYLN